MMTGTAATECLIYAPISWSVHDTPQTITEVKEHNAVYKGQCQ